MANYDKQECRKNLNVVSGVMGLVGVHYCLSLMSGDMGLMGVRGL
jgi:hypothetical protein